ncbi:MAG: catechol 2,3-dioxygenase, partial [Pseudomonadaceae bacterium]|nr:catechol 2,3-dioxygenase [Pseudomonadaceae bacterium]
MRPGHVQIRVLDMDEAVKHYVELIGLIETGRDNQGRVFLKGWTEVDKYSVILREADEPGMDFMGFKCVDEATLDTLAADVRELGIEVKEIPAGDLPDCGRRMQFVAPT